MWLGISSFSGRRKSKGEEKVRNGKKKIVPAQFSRVHNPDYIPPWLREMVGKSDPRTFGPNTATAVVIPLRNSQAHVDGMLRTLFAQSHANFHIVLVGGENDKTWSGISAEMLQIGGLDLNSDPVEYNPRDFVSPVEGIRAITGLRLTVIEATIPEGWEGRDTNLKRNIGGVFALGFLNTDVLIFSDAKITRPPTWVEEGLAIMREQSAQSVAGIMLGTEESLETLWGQFADKALVKRNPEFGSGYMLTKENFGKGQSLPITATWSLSAYAFVLMGGFDIRFTVSYEDYSGAWRLVLNGGQIFCTSEWVVWHKHRQGFKPILMEYIRSGAGAAMLSYFYPRCPFAIKRVREVTTMSLITLVGLTTLAITVVFQLGLLLAVMGFLGLIGYMALGTLNVLKAKTPLAFVFPALTIIFILAFSGGFIYQFLVRGGGAKLIQLMWWSLSMRSLR